MPARSEVDPRFAPLFEALPATYRNVAVALRATIAAEAPHLRRQVKWNNPFWVGASDVLCLQCYPDHVNLGFLRGAELAADYPEIEGTGRAMRHLRIDSVTAARSSGVRRLIRAAVALDRGEGTAAPGPRARRSSATRRA